MFTSALLAFSLLLGQLPPVPGKEPHPLVIGHRGASGQLPEHTLEAYERAIEQGADYIEPDLVVTKDGHLVARHENEIGGTTDVAIRFPKRERTQLIDGQEMKGFFTEDFTLEELRSLRARQRLSFRSQAYNGKYAIPTFEEVIALVERKNRETGRQIGLYIETKHPTHFQKIGLPIEPRLLAALKAHQLDKSGAPVYIQSFEVSNLQWLKRHSELRLIQLIEDVGQPADQIGTKLSYASMITPAGLQQVATYAVGIGPYKRLIVPEHDGRLQAPTHLIENAHAAGLLVHPWTFRTDKEYLAEDYEGNPEEEYLQFFALGVDGVFSDFPEDAFNARERWYRQEIPGR